MFPHLEKICRWVYFIGNARKIIVKYLKFNIVSALFASVLFCSCSQEHQAPPLEQMELTARFFKSIENKWSDAAIRQADKLLTMDRDASYITSLIAIQEANDTVLAAQNALDEGNISRSIEIIRAGRRKHSNNRTFSEVYPKISQLRNAQKLFRALQRAKNASAMRSARIAAKAGLSMNITPELEAFLIDYEVRGKKLAAREKAAAVAKEQAAREAALAAKAAEKRRKITEEKFSQETARKAAEGERVRKNNQFPQ